MLDTVITSSVLILAVIAARFLFGGRISCRVRYALWGLVLLRLLIPVSLPAGEFSVLNVLPRYNSGAVTADNTPAADGLADNLPGLPEGDSGYDGVPAVREPEENTASAGGIDFAGAAAAVWVSGSVILAVWFAAVNTAFLKRLRKNRRIADTSEFPDFKLPVYTIGGADSPFLFGLVKPSVYIPDSVYADLPVTEQALRHEYTHYRHLDHIWSFLRIICLCVYWFNPLVWLAAYLSREDCELCCDEAVIKQLGDGMRAEYGRMLLGMITENRHKKTAVCATTMAAGKKSLKRRISMIAEGRKTAAYAFFCAIAILAAVSGCTFTGAAKPRTGIDLSAWLGSSIENPAAEFVVTDTGYKETKTIKAIVPLDAEYTVEYGHGMVAVKKELGFFEAGQPVTLTLPAGPDGQRYESGQYLIVPKADGITPYYGANDYTLSDTPEYSVLCIELPEDNYSEASITEKIPPEMEREYDVNGETVSPTRFVTTSGHVFFGNKLILTAVRGEQIGITIRSEARVYGGFLPEDSKRGGQYDIELTVFEYIYDENNVLTGYEETAPLTVTVNEIPFEEYEAIWNAAVS